MSTRFCNLVACSPFPVEIDFLIRYAAHLTLSGRTYGTITNHLSRIKHVNNLLGCDRVWDNHFRFNLVLRVAKRYIGLSSPTRKSPITPKILLQIYPLFSMDKPLHAALWALFLMAFFNFLRKSNLVSDVDNSIPFLCDQI